ncbi:MAG: hypothetical protein VB078_02585 [Clostridiaceae bacterium]|nr:hypothetical protein [Clostridiaceae bacterium]
MFKKLLVMLICVVLLFSACAENSSEPEGKPTGTDVQAETGAEQELSQKISEDRAARIKSDLMMIKEELPRKHKNPFSIITQADFDAALDGLAEKSADLSDEQVMVELKRIIASIGDAHTHLNCDEHFFYPIELQMFGSDLYVINTDKSLEDMMFSKVVKIGDTDIDEVITQLTTLIPHENDNWLSVMLPQSLEVPTYLYGLGIIDSQEHAIFTVEKNGEAKTFDITSIPRGNKIEFINNDENDVLRGTYQKYYDYEYLPQYEALYFEYNSCMEMSQRKMEPFVQEMFADIEREGAEKIIVDLRRNGGGNSSVLHPFTERLAAYIGEGKKTKVYILISRRTISSGIFAIFDIKQAAQAAVVVGQPTGGALDCYGDIKTLTLPNLKMSISYSTKYFEFSKKYNIKNPEGNMFSPDVFIESSIEDYEKGRDAVLEYVLAD